MEHLRMECL